MSSTQYDIAGTGPEASTTTAIRLVAGREVSTRLHSKAFRVMTLIMLIAIVAMTLIFKFIGDDGPSASKVGVVGGDHQVSAQVTAAATAVGGDVTTTAIGSAAAARSAVADGDIDAAVVPDESGSLTVIVESDLSDSLRNAFTVAARNLALDRQIVTLGGDPAAVAAAVGDATITVDQIKPPRPYNVTELVLGLAAGILIYLSLMICGQWVAQGVVEEKSSRIVELLLATVRPWELMTGKVLGIGLVGLIQIALLGIVGVGLSAGLGVLSLSVSAAVGTIVWLIVWYLVGFVMYAFAFAGAGALVSRQEDAGGVVTPVLMFVIVGYVVGVSVLPSDPTNELAEVMSIIPLFAPTLMPIRLAMGGVPAWQAVLSLALAIATIPLLAALAGRIYRNAVIHIGARVSLKTALAKPA